MGVVRFAAGQQTAQARRNFDRHFSRVSRNHNRYGAPQRRTLQAGDPQRHSQLFRSLGLQDDHTDVRILGAIAKLLPELFSLKAVQDVIVKEWKDPVKAESAARSHERITTSTVKPNQGNPETPYKFEFPKWHEMGEGIAIPSIPAGHSYED